jgi:organic radical activating enzyme
MPVRDVIERVLALQVGLLVISGGEPMSQQRHLVPLVDALTAQGVDVEIETNGTRVPDDRLVRAGVHFNVSPKLAHTGDRAERRIVPHALRGLAAVSTSTFKFVCRDRSDLDEVAALVELYGIRSVWVMPEGQSSAQVTAGLRDLVDDVIDRGWNITTRLHVLAWESRRGV